MYKFLLFLFIPFLLFSQNQTYKVIKVKDGDTVCLLMNGKEQVIRLAHIDCPEKRQAFGTKAKQIASDLCFGKFVKLKSDFKKDRNKRIIGEIILPNGRNLNKELVRKGFAWHYKKYSKDDSYQKLEQKARFSKIGLWADKKPIAPWEFRKKPKKTIQNIAILKK